MNTERQRIAERIFAEAMGVQDAAARQTLLTSRCGSDVELLMEVKSLLEFHDQTDGPVDHAEVLKDILQKAEPERDVPLPPGGKIGHYHVPTRALEPTRSSSKAETGFACLQAKRLE